LKQFFELCRAKSGSQCFIHASALKREANKAGGARVKRSYKLKPKLLETSAKHFAISEQHKTEHKREKSEREMVEQMKIQEQHVL
jgi:hypothetical protein